MPHWHKYNEEDAKAMCAVLERRLTVTIATHLTFHRILYMLVLCNFYQFFGVLDVTVKMKVKKEMNNPNNRIAAQKRNRQQLTKTPEKEIPLKRWQKKHRLTGNDDNLAKKFSTLTV